MWPPLNDPVKPRNYSISELQHPVAVAIVLRSDFLGESQCDEISARSDERSVARDERDSVAVRLGQSAETAIKVFSYRMVLAIVRA
jgi:hypothetical protein